MSETRAQHYIPQFILRNFTPNGTTGEHVFVTSPAEKKQWRSLPSQMAHHRDFYRVEIDGVDPNIVERFLSKLEAGASPVFREMIQLEQIPLSARDYELLMTFLAFSFARVPSQREMLERSLEAMNKQILRIVLETPERWAEFLGAQRRETAGSTDEDVSYLKMKDFVDRDEYSVRMEGNNYQVKMMFRTAEIVLPLLARRRWGLLISRSGEFICADRPALFFNSPEPPNHPPALGFEDTSVAFPVSRHVILIGAGDMSNEVRYLNKKSVAGMNRIALVNTHRYLFSSKSEFPWLDRSGKVRYNLPPMAKDESPPVVRAYVGGSSVAEELVEMRDRPLRLLN